MYDCKSSEAHEKADTPPAVPGRTRRSRLEGAAAREQPGPVSQAASRDQRPHQNAIHAPTCRGMPYWISSIVESSPGPGALDVDEPAGPCIELWWMVKRSIVRPGKFASTEMRNALVAA